MHVDGAVVTAVVNGGSAYRVRLTVDGAAVDGRCSCPYGTDGMFCKHCVATVLAWLYGDAEPSQPQHQQQPESESDEELQRYLTTQDPAWLVGELLRAAGTDPLLRARLEVAAGADARHAVGEQPLRVRLQRVIDIVDYVDYRSAYAYFLAVDEELEQVAALIEQGFADAAMRLAEYALRLLEDAAELIDDSDGGLGAAVSRVEEIHLAACEAGEPDPVRLAEYLVEWAQRSEHEVFRTALRCYADVLGPAGLARYRELVEAAWRALPPKKPHDYGSGRYTVIYLMEQLAEYEGGADALIDVLARDLGSSYDVLRIAQRLCADGRDDEALAWLSRGMAEFAPDPRLPSLAAACHLRAGRRVAAAELLWLNFTARPTLENYIALHEAAAQDFPAWRDRALAVLGAASAASARFTDRPFMQSGGRSVLVEVRLWEGDVAAAWAAAVDGGCRDELWLRVARARAVTHPADAIPIMTAAADQCIRRKNRGAYQDAATLLVEVAELFARCDRSADFRDHLRALRSAHKPKRALREELDRAQLP